MIGCIMFNFQKLIVFCEYLLVVMDSQNERRKFFSIMCFDIQSISQNNALFQDIARFLLFGKPVEIFPFEIALMCNINIPTVFQIFTCYHTHKFYIAVLFRRYFNEHTVSVPRDVQNIVLQYADLPICPASEWNTVDGNLDSFISDYNNLFAQFLFKLSRTGML